jgi:hypothetical protein
MGGWGKKGGKKGVGEKGWGLGPVFVFGFVLLPFSI